MNHTRFADWVTIWVVHLPERTEKAGPCIAAIAGSFRFGKQINAQTGYDYTRTDFLYSFVPPQLDSEKHF